MMNDSFGARLRRERERQHITLAQIADTTKIKASLFDGLERGDVSRWPAGIFRRSFVRAYAKAIGLDPEQTCREFVECFPEAGDTAPRPAGTPTAGPATARRSPALAWADAAPRDDSDDEPGDGDRGGRDDEDDATRLRLTLAEQGVPIAATAPPGPDGGTPAVLESTWRWRAVALDLGTVLIVSVTAFVILDEFWMPLAVSSLVYYFGSTLLLGATPGVLFFTNAARAHEPAPSAEPPVTSLDRALEMRDVLLADARPRPMPPPHRQPVDIDSRRVRA